ncbi:MAG: phosphodiester glycosidase family protein, partial [Planctomycetales bacterium]|nr:phosphodiester glycosidase family protein [Planctomycetales bacterium]
MSTDFPSVWPRPFASPPVQRSSVRAGTAGWLATRLGLLLAAMLLLPWYARATEIDWSQANEIHPGIHYAKFVEEDPRRLVVHVARIDLWLPETRLHTTGRRADWILGEAETDRETTRDYLRSLRQAGHHAVLGFNADAFSPWPVPYNQSTPTDLLGLAIAKGEIVSSGSGTPSLIVSRTGKASITRTNADFESNDVDLAVSGFSLCLDEGVPQPSGDDLHPRTGVGLSRDGRYLIVVVIDGRQPASHGATTTELGEWLRDGGAFRGINMDGGGSSTLAWWNTVTRKLGSVDLLNRPVGNSVRAENWPEALFLSSERANGNNVAVVQAVRETPFDPRLHLLLDDHWIAKSEGLVRVHGQAVPMPEPILWPDDPRTEADCAWGNVIREPDGRFRLWYCTMNLGAEGAGPHEMAAAGVWGRGADFDFHPRSPADRRETESMVGKYAESLDGLHWTKPNLGLVSIDDSTDNNVVLTGRMAAEQTAGALTNFDGYTVLRDDSEPDPQRRYKMVAHWESVHVWDNEPVSGSLNRDPEFIRRCQAARGEYITSSPDGLVWTQPLERLTDIPTEGGDRLLVTRDEARGRWTAYVRSGGWAYPAFSHSDDLRHWSPAEPAPAITPAAVDARAVECMIPFSYADMEIGFPCGMDKEEGRFTVMVASRHGDEPWRVLSDASRLIPAGPEGSYYASGAVPLHNAPFVLGDRMLIFFNAFSRDPAHPSEFGTRSIGVATMRRDGFAGVRPAE